MPLKKSAAKSQIYQIKITLLDVKPAIWRRLLIRDDIKLSALAEILEMAMGWSGGHLHEFETESDRYGIPDDDFPDDDLLDERKKKFNQMALAEGDSFGFAYDFGDGWMHEVKIERILEPESEKNYPVCLDGARACPPDDCGGPPGFEELVKAMKGKKSKRREELVEWLGGEFEPEKFDLDEVNAGLRQL